MPFTTAHSQPTGASTVIHSETGLLLIPNPTIAQVERNRAILFAQGAGAVYQFYAGQAYVDFVKAATSAGFPTTIAGLRDYVRKLRNARWTNATHEWKRETITTARDTTMTAPDVYTFKHGFFSGVGQSSCLMTGAANFSDGHPQGDIVLHGQIFGYGVARKQGVAQPRPTNCAYVLLPTDVSVPELARRLIATQTHWIDGAREYAASEIVKFLDQQGYKESTRYMEPVLIHWSDDGVLQYSPPAILMPHHNRTAQGHDPTTYFKGPRVRAANPFGGRVEVEPGVFQHFPVAAGGVGAPHLDSLGYEGFTVVTDTTTANAAVIATRLSPGPMERYQLGFGATQSAFSVDGVDLAGMMSGQPYKTFYDATTRAKRNWGGASGISIFDKDAMSGRWSMTMDDDFTQTVADLQTELSTDGQASPTKIAQFASSQVNGEAPTNYDSVCFTARKVRRFVTECMKVAGTKVVFDAVDAERILTNRL